jgi:hypothetical protein
MSAEIESAFERFKQGPPRTIEHGSGSTPT